jgi:DNA-binding CsgD family transcriptional regulator/tetratricopeptide (TPR) repeat protein
VDSGLIELGETVHFRHPLMRSAAYRSASPEDRARAHTALAVAIDDASRSVWHRAAAADGADETLAAELEVSADQAFQKGAQVTAAAAFERAAELSLDDEKRAFRLRRAAETSMDAGRADVGLALAERAWHLSEAPDHRAALEMVRALEAGRRGSPLDGYRHTRAAGDLVAHLSPDQARAIYLWAFFGSFQGGWAQRTLDDAEASLKALEHAGGNPEFTRHGLAFLEGVRALLAGDSDMARERFDEAEQLGEALRNAPLATALAFHALVRADFARMCEIVEEVIALQRAQGAVIGLAGSMGLLAGAQVFDRRLRSAVSSIDEGIQLARQLGYENDETGLLALRARVAALQGREESCREDAEAALRQSLANGIGWATLNAHLALADLELGLGNAREALDHYSQLDPSLIPPIAMVACPDIIDAALRASDRERALGALEALEGWAPVSPARLVHATLARARAQLSEDDEEAERLFVEALKLHEGDVAAFERARTHLAYGEWLRRRRRRIDSRSHLSTALSTFEGMGAGSWAERARGELAATGQTARKRDVSTLDDLTPQELRIAQLVAAGATNRDAAAQLFVSPKTVEYHLRKVFMKLGVSSRVELAGTDFGAPEPSP